MRNTTRLKLSCLLLLPLIPLLARGEMQDEWVQFLTHPRGDRYQVLSQRLRDCNDTGCAHQVKPNSQDVVRLLRLVQRGDPNAVELAFLSLRFLDGGDLEDVFRSLGSLTETHPRLFLKEVSQHRVTQAKYESLLTMLPLSTVDNEAKKRRLIERRIRSLAAVKDKPLAVARDEAIAILDHFLSELAP